MEAREARGKAIVYIAIAMFTILLSVAGWLALDAVALKDQVMATGRDSELKADMARSAMLEGFERILEESGILASYSFVEYLQGKRSAASMDALFDSEIEAYRDVLAYAFFEVGAEPRFSKLSSRAGAGEALDELVSRAGEARARLGGGHGTLVLSGTPGGREPRFLLYQPVRISGRLAGMVASSVGLGKAISTYLYPLATGGRTVTLDGPGGARLWSGGDAAPTGAGSAASGSAYAIERIFILGDAPFAIRLAETEASVRAQFGAIGRWRMVVFFGLLAFVALSALGLALYYVADQRQRSLAREEEGLKRAIEAREREISASELRYERLFEEAGDAILIIDDKGRITRCNTRALDMFGLPRERLVGRTTIELSPPLQPSGARTEDLAAAINERWRVGVSQFFEWTHLRGDGSPFIVEIGLSPVDFGGRKMAQAFLRDITGRKEGERLLREAFEDRELLLKELHHRVKNNLQFLQSLIELQKEGAGPEARKALDATQSRIGALSAAYFSIAGDLGRFRLDARDYISAICAQARDGFAQRVGGSVLFDFRCEELPLGLEVAVPLGLALRELLANALVHGSPEEGNARIEVEFSSGGGTLRLGVRDFGKGRLEGLKEGLGLTLASAMARQLGGGLELREAGPGLHALFDFPANRA